jgi:hypothetical protein
MAIKKYKIDSKTKGSLGENEDTWTLLVDAETGERTVEHWWHHMDPYKGRLISEGEKVLPLADFQSGPLAEKLAAAMAKADADA